MLNLVPKDQKNKLIREYRIRFFVILFALTLTAEVISLILLIPPYLTAKTRIDLLNARSAGLQAQNVTTETTKLEAIVRKTTSYLNIFTSNATPKGVLSVVDTMVGLRGESVKIKNISYKTQNGQQYVLLQGVASSRQALLDFSKKLKTVSGVTSADLPVSDFVKSADIDFSVTVVIQPKKI